MSPAAWLLIWTALAVVAAIGFAVVKREHVHERTAEDAMWVRSIDEYRARANRHSRIRPGA